MTADDPREPKRRVAFSDNNRKCALVGLPIAKTAMKTKQRSLFTACGEVRTYNQTYSGVQKRPLQSLPRLTPSQKEAMIGKPLRELPSKLVAAAATGRPLFWQEVKPIGLLAQAFQDFCVSHVCDLSPGSGACATAAAMNGITYDGFCRNTTQQRWLESLLDRAMLNVLTNEKAPHHDTELAQSICMYFASSIENLQPGKPSDKKVEQQPRKKQKKAQAETKTDDRDTTSSTDEL